MQVSRLHFWTQSALTGLIAVNLMSTALGQRDRTRISRVERTGFELDASGRQDPGFDFRGSSLDPASEIDVSRVDQRALVNLLKDAVAETERLYRSLQQDAQQSRELYSSLAEVRKLRSGASYIVQDLEEGRSLQRLLPVIRELSSDWNLLSHQLGQAPRISRRSLDIVNRIDGQARQIEKMFQLDPQLNRRALVSELATMHTTLENIVQELQYSQDKTGNLVYNARKLGQQVRLVEDMVLDGVRYDRIVSEYNRFGRMWTALLTDLRPINNRYVQREIRDLADADSRMHDLLWLEKSANREHLRQLANTLIRDVDEFFNRTPLRLVVDLKNVDSILDQASEFYGTVQHFKDLVENKGSKTDLMQAYEYVEEYGEDFLRSFASLRSEQGRVVLKEIEDSIASLRAELHIGGTVSSVDTHTMVIMAARLENHADHLHSDVRRWLDRDRQSWRGDALQAMDRFIQRCQRIHRMLQSHPTRDEVKRETINLNNAWKTLNQYLTRCRTNDRAHIDSIRRDINSALYDLEAPFAL